MKRLVFATAAVVGLLGLTAATPGSCEGVEPNGNPTAADKAVKPDQIRRRGGPLEFWCDWAFGHASKGIDIRYRATGVQGGNWQHWSGTKPPGGSQAAWKVRVGGWPGGVAELYATSHQKIVLTCRIDWGDVHDGPRTAPWQENGGTVYVQIATVGDRHGTA
jgi:hypothetical protein